MADRKIPSFPEKTTLESTDVILLSDTVSGTSKKVACNNLATAVDKGDFISADTPNVITQGTDDLLVVDPVDLISGDASNDLTQGTDNLLYVASSGSSGIGFMHVYATPSIQVISPSTLTKIQFQNIAFDANGWFDNVTNYRFQPDEAGKYLIHVKWAIDGALATDYSYIQFHKNGSLASNTDTVAGATEYAGGIKDRRQSYEVIELNGTTDYLEIFVWHNVSAVIKTLQNATFTAMKLGA